MKINDTIKKWLYIGGGVLVALLFAYIAGCTSGYNKGIKYAEEHAPVIKPVDTTWFTEKETIEVEKPPIDTPVKVITKTFYIPVPDTASVGDSVAFDIPYIEAHASIPDTLDIYYHGYLDIGIDSINYSLFKTTEIITNNVTVEVAKLPKLAFNAGVAGLWYENKPNGLIYGKLTYTHGKTGYSAFGGYKTDFVGNNSPFFGVGIDITLPLIK